MVRMNRKEKPGKFVLRQNRLGRILYYLESGVADVGTPHEQKYINFTRYADEAKGFKTIKTARAMAEKLRREYRGIEAVVCVRPGR